MNSLDITYINAFIVEANLWQFFISINRLGPFSHVCVGDLCQQSFTRLNQLHIAICTQLHYDSQTCENSLTDGITFTTDVSQNLIQFHAQTSHTLGTTICTRLLCSSAATTK